MELLLEFMKLVLPAAIVLVAMYLTVKTFVNKDFELAQKEFDKKLVDLKAENTKVILPLKLQAYERLCLFMERISLNNMIVRVNDPAFTSAQLQQRLSMDVREEFNHNLSQQIYISDEAWLILKRAQEEIIIIINKAAEKVDRNDRGIELAKKIFEELMQRETNPTDIALKFLKDEIRRSM
jgi:diphthamide synthase (EF-2-diphthine--ammonia ligase)